MVDIEEYLEKGFFHTRVILEVVGAPEEHVNNTLRLFVKNIKDSDDKYIVTKEEFENAEKTDDEKFFTGFAELEILMKDFRALFEFCLDFMPSSIEIMEPEVFRFNANDYSLFTNELLGKLHQLDGIAKDLRAKVTLLEGNAAMLLRNNVLILLKQKERTLDELAKTSGTKADQLKLFLDKWVEDKIMTEKDGTYSIKK